MKTLNHWRSAAASILAAVLVTLAAGSQVWAQQPAPEPPPEVSFLIETITVEGNRKFPAGIIVAESQLQEGQEYSEAGLRDANNRILRLPLILDAEFELRKGSQRGTYELVIQVTEARRWFFGLTSDYSYWADPVSVSGLDTSSTTEADNSVVGYRVPVGGDGLFFVTIGGIDGALSLGYTQFNLFSRNITLNLKAAWSDCAEVRERSGSNEIGEDGCATEIFDLGLDPTFSSWTLQGDNFRGRLNLAIPLGGNQSIHWLSTYRTVKAGLRRSAYRPSARGAYFFENEEELDTSVAWVVNTEDDSILPTRGRFLDAGFSYRALQAELNNFLDPDSLADMNSRELRLFFSGRRHWPINEKTTLSVGWNAHVGKSRVENLPLESGEIVSDDLGVWGGSARFQHAWFFWQVYNGEPKHPKRRNRWREMRWENGVEALVAGTSPDFNQPENPLTGFRVYSGVIFRNTWGVFRLQLTYLDVSGR